MFLSNVGSNFTIYTEDYESLTDKQLWVGINRIPIFLFKLRAGINPAPT